MAKLTWKEITERKNLIRGDLQSVEGLMMHRGPLASITVEKDWIRLSCLWSAWFNPRESRWEEWPPMEIIVPVTTVPVEGHLGQIQFNAPDVGSFTLFPIGDESNLERIQIWGMHFEAN